MADPFSPMGPYSQAGKPAPNGGRGSAYEPIRAAYAQTNGGQMPMRPNPAALSAYAPPARQRPMGYGYGMAPQRGAYGMHPEPDADEWGGPSDMDADNGGGYGMRPRSRRPGGMMGGRFAGVSPSDPYSNGGGY